MEKERVAVKPRSSRVWPEGGARAEVQPEASGENNRGNKETLYNSYLTSFDIKRFSTDSFVTFPFDSLNFTKQPPPHRNQDTSCPVLPSSRSLTPDRELWQGGEGRGPVVMATPPPKGHSQASLLSKLDRPMAKACRAHMG